MKCLRLYFLGSKTVIYAARRMLFNCVLRCHNISQKGKVKNILSSYSVAGANIPTSRLADPNVHQLIILGHLHILE